MTAMQPTLELTLSRTLRATPAAVFAAWTQPSLMARWLAPPEMKLVRVDADVRVGGRYRLELDGTGCSGGAGRAVVEGMYREIDPGRKLQFTWNSHPGEPETLVTVELQETPEGGTLLHLTHQGFADIAACDRHRSGWEILLANLVAM